MSDASRMRRLAELYLQGLDQLANPAPPLLPEPKQLELMGGAA